jgi:anti-sigma regulatory factor (Ser/Thr protein kinase)
VLLETFADADKLLHLFATLQNAPNETLRRHPADKLPRCDRSPTLLNSPSMTHTNPDSICIPARFSALPQLLAPLAPAAQAVVAPGLTRTLLRAQLAVEELFANSIHHGYGGESDQPVWLSVALQGDALQVTYADQAAAFDPFAAIEPPDDNPATPVDGRKVGGLGRLLVRELAGRCAYKREEGRNVTVLEFNLNL